MMRGKVLLSLATIIIIGLIALQDRYRTARQDAGKELGFPFEIMSEERLCCFGPPTWQAFVRVPKVHYSRKNLDRLFRFFSLRHPNMHERLYVRVYTGELNRSAELRNHPVSVPWLETERKELHSAADLVPWDAMFTRTDGFGLPGRIESYSYRPDLDNPDEFRHVILKGTLILRPKNIIETWKPPDGNIEMQVLAYYLHGVDPAGVYYTFQSFDAKRSEWQSIMTSRENQRIPIPTDSVVFVTDTTTYVTMGSMYAVTTDGGTSWAVWDAERDFEMGRWHDHWHIARLTMTVSGNGTMKLSPSPQSDPMFVLNTSDFGRSWNLKQ